MDEWQHRETVLSIMRQYAIPPSRYHEIKYHIIDKIISASCYVIGWFMPYYFAGRLESGNVCEYFIMMRYFNELGIRGNVTAKWILDGRFLLVWKVINERPGITRTSAHRINGKDAMQSHVLAEDRDGEVQMDLTIKSIRLK